jgi:hypothetical protein
MRRHGHPHSNFVIKISKLWTPIIDDLYSLQGSLSQRKNDSGFVGILLKVEINLRKAERGRRVLPGIAEKNSTTSEEVDRS